MRGPRFDVELTPGGYAWWYLDALSDDGRYGLTAIAFLGSVFSPYYSAARKERGQVNPLEHVAINVVLSGPRNENAWVFTERSGTSVQRNLDELVIGRSRMAWDGDGLLLTLDEPTIGTPPLSKVGTMPMDTAASTSSPATRARAAYTPLAGRISCAALTLAVG